jgi:type II secretory pathway component PulF
MTQPTPEPDRGRLTATNAGEVVEYLASGSAAGLPLDEIFLALAEETDHRGLRRAATRIAEELRRGADMRTALESVGSLPPYLRSALAVSTDLGQTAAVLAGLAQHETARKRLRRQLRSALLYPAIVLGLLLAVVSGLTMLVLPQFESIYVDFDLELPELTVLLLGMARVIPWLLVGLAAAVAAYFLICLSQSGRRIVHWLRTSVPVLGRLWIWNGQHEFASVLGALTAHRVPMDEALACTAESLRDANVARATRLAARKCAGGALLSRSLSESIHFDPALPALVSWGELEGSLPAALRQAASTFEDELDLQVAFLQRMMPSLLFITVISTMFMFIVGLMVPLVDLINNLTY